MCKSNFSVLPYSVALMYIEAKRPCAISHLSKETFSMTP